MTLLNGARLAAYEIQAPIGSGGMGEVYRARDTRLERNVAIKVLPETVGAAELWERFEREARAAAALTHPNICAVYDVGEFDGRRFLVMELIDGVTLREYIDEKPLEPAAARSFGAQIADALDAAYRNGVIHRDIKPTNVMIVDGRHAKVLDFGIARQTTAAGHEQTAQSLTVSGAIVGTPAYLAPELWSGARANVSSDLWSLGAVIHEMLSGRHHFLVRRRSTLGLRSFNSPLRRFHRPCLQRCDRSSNVVCASVQRIDTRARARSEQHWKRWSRSQRLLHHHSQRARRDFVCARPGPRRQRRPC